MRYKTSHSIFGSLPEKAFRKKVGTLGANAPMTLEGCSGGGSGCFFCCVGNTVSCWVCSASQAVGDVGCFVCQNILQPVEDYACHKFQQFVCCPASGIARIGASFLTDGASCALCAAYCIACEAYCIACDVSCVACGAGCYGCNPLCGCYGCGPCCVPCDPCAPCCSSCCGPCCSCCSSCGSNPKMPKSGRGTGGSRGAGGKKGAGGNNPMGSIGGKSGNTGGTNKNPLCSLGGTKTTSAAPGAGPALCLTGGTVHGQQVQLACTPTFTETVAPEAMAPMGGVQMCSMGMKKGGAISLVCDPTFTPTETPLSSMQYQQQSPVSCGLPGYEDGGSVEYQAQMVDGNPQRLAGFAAQMAHPHIAHGGPNPMMQSHEFAEGGDVHQPEFYSEGGLHNTYVTGKGDGTSDSIPAMLANGEFVIPADVVASLGNGSNDSGAKVLDEFLKTIRNHKRDAEPNKLPPDSKGPLGYLLEAKKKVK